MTTAIDMSLTKKYEIRYYDIDYNQVLKPSALLNYMQDVATVSAEKWNFGYTFTQKNNYAWFLIKYKMEFDEYPSHLDEIVIKTQARGVSRIMAHRDFWFYNSDGKFLGRATSGWMLVDMDSREIVPIQKELGIMGLYEKNEDDLEFEKIKPFDEVDFEKEFDVRYDDIDLNKHANNANYISWAFEALPFEFKASNKLKTLDMVFKKEIQYGNKVLSLAKFDEQEKITHHIVKNSSTGDDLCLIKATFK